MKQTIRAASIMNSRVPEDTSAKFSSNEAGTARHKSNVSQGKQTTSATNTGTFSKLARSMRPGRFLFTVKGRASRQGKNQAHPDFNAASQKDDAATASGSRPKDSGSRFGAQLSRRSNKLLSVDGGDENPAVNGMQHHKTISDLDQRLRYDVTSVNQASRRSTAALQTGSRLVGQPTSQILRQKGDDDGFGSPENRLRQGTAPIGCERENGAGFNDSFTRGSSWAMTAWGSIRKHLGSSSSNSNTKRRRKPSIAFIAADQEREDESCCCCCNCKESTRELIGFSLSSRSQPGRHSRKAASSRTLPTFFRKKSQFWRMELQVQVPDPSIPARPSISAPGKSLTILLVLPSLLHLIHIILPQSSNWAHTHSRGTFHLPFISATSDSPFQPPASSRHLDRLTRTIFPFLLDTLTTVTSDHGASNQDRTSHSLRAPSCALDLA